MSGRKEKKKKKGRGLQSALHNFVITESVDEGEKKGKKERKRKKELVRPHFFKHPIRTCSSSD